MKPPSDLAAPRPKPRAALWFGLALGFGVLALFALGKSGYLGTLDEAIAEMQALAGTGWGLPAVILIFCVAAFIGVPQFALIGAAVLAFGPVQGAAYSWIANMVSGAVTFWIGRIAGERAVRRFAGDRMKRFTGFIARNAFMASLVVRNVPTGPFLVVNMVFGAVGAKFLHYWGGMAIGIVPKILLVTLAGQSLIAAVRGHPLIAAVAALAAVMLFTAIWLYRRRRRAEGKPMPPLADQPVDKDSRPVI